MNLVAVVVLALVVLGAGSVLYMIVRQQGRMLLRIEELEGLLGVGEGGQRMGTIGLAAHGSHAVGAMPAGPMSRRGTL